MREIGRVSLRLQSLLWLLVFLVSLTAALYPVIRTPVKFREGLGPFGDSLLYHTIAFNVYEGHGFSGSDDGGRALGFPPSETPAYEPAALRGPVYPYFLCAVYKFLGNREAMGSVFTWHINWDRVRIAQCVLHALTSLLVFGIVRCLWPESLWPALVAALLHACCFYSLFYARALLSESVTTLILTGFIWAGVLSLKTNKTVWGLLAGVLLGGTILSRSEYLLFPLVFGAYVFWVRRGDGWTGVRRAALVLVAAIGTVAPWTIRNYCQFHQFIPVTVGGFGSALYIGTFESAKSQSGWRSFAADVFYFPGEQERATALQAVFDKHCANGSIRAQAAGQALQQMAIRRIKTHPWDCLVHWICKMPRLWYQNYIPMYQQREAADGWFIFYFSFALVAFWCGAREQRILMGLVGLLFLYLNGIFFPLHVEPRYGVALMPGLIALTGIGLGKTGAWILDGWRRRREKGPRDERASARQSSLNALDESVGLRD